MTQHYVYVLQSAAEVVYVGCTSNIGTRLSGHQGRPWWPDISTIDVHCYPTKRAGLDAERDLIETLNPRYNTIYTNRDARVLKSLATRQAKSRARHERGETCPRGCSTCNEKRRRYTLPQPKSRRRGMSAHGRASNYTNGGCRCADCQRAQATRIRRRRAARFAWVATHGLPTTVEHGMSAYDNWGCRCAICSKAKSDRNRADYRARILPT